MDKFYYWRLCEELSVVQAALLIIGEDPNDYPKILDWGQTDNSLSSPPDTDDPTPDTLSDPPPGLPKNFSATFTALTNAIVGDRLPATIRNNYGEPWECPHGVDPVDWYESTIMVEDLKSWLKSRGITPVFFFPNPQPVPDYLNPDHPCYAYKLVAAIKAWEAVTSGSQIEDNLNTPKQKLIAWLYDNAKYLDLEENGKPNKDAIENQIAKVANWKKGGPPKTPGSK